MATPRREPFIYVTWITKILAGDQSCEWSAWFKAHYSDYEKQPRDFDIKVWTSRHGEMVRQRAGELQKEGYTVFLEDQNKFTLKGASATLQGKPDIVAVRESDQDYLVIDCKSGKQRDSDTFQVLIYMMALPLAHPACKGKVVRGQLEYPKPEDRTDIDVLPKKTLELITSTIQRVAQAQPLPIVPTYRECRFCELTSADCTKRVDTDTQAPVTSSLF
jgi:CRISPR/Cas system-associated exonuclease Cas4 (RecB family)